ncbi:MAG: MarR family transcriptional regulator [Bacteroidetes bacterium HGW-Bacteroidetes-12]|nr:MAG: MarR family transcriptional regulator [Bacteroidetes bacterium HGW-Bacteroidetes-12]
MNNSPFNLDHQNEDVSSKIVSALERISQTFRVLLWEESKKFGVTPIQIQVLIFINFHSEEKCKVTYLAKEFNMAKPTVSDTIKTLEEKGFIEKKHLKSDSRSYLIQLTKKGKALANKTSSFTSVLQQPINTLSAADKDNLLTSLFGVIHHLNKTGVIAIQRMCFSCSYYKFNNYHFCGLLNKELKTNDLRLDCAEHQLTLS